MTAVDAVTSGDLVVLRALVTRYLEEPAPHGRVSVKVTEVCEWLGGTDPDEAWASTLRLRACVLAGESRDWVWAWGPITETFAIGTRFHIRLSDHLRTLLRGDDPRQALDQVLADLAAAYGVRVPA